MIRINFDFPRPEAATAYDGWVELTGWAVAEAPLADITIAAKGHAPQRALWGFPRQDIAQAFPSACLGAYSGFWCNLDLSTSVPGLVELEFVVRDKAGNEHRGSHSLRIGQNVASAQAVPRPTECPWCESPDIVPSADWERGRFRLWTCAQCGIGFVAPRPALEVLKAYYDDVYWQHSPITYAADQEHYDSDRFAELIRAHHPHCRDIAEIGCGPGLLLNGLRRRGFTVSGQDYSAQAAAIAQRVFGIAVTVAPLSALGGAQFDCIVLRHVLEHSPDALGDLRAVATCLRPGGMILLIAPNLDSLIARTLGRYWEWFIPPAHLFYFSPRSLECFATRHGLQTLHCETRRGDGTLSSQALQAFVEYEESRLPTWRVRELKTLQRCLAESPAFEHRTMGELGLGNEVLALFRRPLSPP